MLKQKRESLELVWWSVLRRTTMPRKPGLNSEFVMFDVLDEDGSQRSNRKVPRALIGGHRRRQAGARISDRAGPRHRGNLTLAARDQEHRPLRREEEGVGTVLTRSASRAADFPLGLEVAEIIIVGAHAEDSTSAGVARTVSRVKSAAREPPRSHVGRGIEQLRVAATATIAVGLASGSDWIARSIRCVIAARAG